MLQPPALPDAWQYLHSTSSLHLQLLVPPFPILSMYVFFDGQKTKLPKHNDSVTPEFASRLQGVIMNRFQDCKCNEPVFCKQLVVSSVQDQDMHLPSCNLLHLAIQEGSCFRTMGNFVPSSLHIILSCKLILRFCNLCKPNSPSIGCPF